MSIMYVSVRCHAVITPDGIYKNAVVSYKGTCVPAYDKPFAVEVDDISVSPFTGEIHSTVDYNGIAVAGQVKSLPERLSVGTLQAIVSKIAATVKSPVSVVRFIPLN